MIVNNAPTLGKLAEDHGEEAFGLLAVFHREVPASARYGGVGTEHADGGFREIEFAHLAPA